MLPTVTAVYGNSFETKAANPLPVSGLVSPEPWLMYAGAGPTLAGLPVSASQALQVPTVSACVNLISSAIGALPCRIFKDDPKGGREEAPEHPAFDLVFADAADWQEAGVFRAQLVTDALLHGNGYAYVQRDGDGIPTATLRLRPEFVSIFVHPETWEPVYKVSGLQGLETVAHSDMIHVACPSSQDGITGVSPIWHAREAIALAIALERHLSRIMANGGRPSGVLTCPKEMSPTAVQNVRASFEAQHSGQNSGKPAVLSGGATWTPTEFKTVDLQFAEARAFQISEIAKAFNVPPTLVGELAKATLSNSEQMGQQFLTKTLAHWITALRAAYRRTLLTPADRKTHSVDFDLSGLVRADSVQRAAYLASLRSSGLITSNEGRRAEGYPPHPNGDRLESPHVTAGNAAPKDQNPADV